MPVQMTERAADEIKRIMEAQKEDNKFVRFGVVGGGCSGLSYSFAFDDNFDEEKDGSYDCHGVKLVVDKKSDLFLDGTTIDWYEGLDKRGFTFDNPNSVKSCGCGSSFQA